jgi:Zn-dependent protease
MIELGLILLLIGLSWWLRPEAVRHRWLGHVARHGKNAEQRARAARLLDLDRNRDLHS